ncbi:toprim domain-containing protein [Saccharophagus degradans]|uniref:toprim domain-containing protein n=1 Tax=Saccharophagus degradans TaxID=86304 RepID=UPI001C080B66|nr:toprim domain-containing protein [Saccharophagus degradans]MBU2987257.1 toprim domain-containing protein [Saccharophagus degradans]
MNNKKGRTMAAQHTQYTHNYTNPTHEFSKELEAVFGVPIDPIADGEPHRFDDPEGKRGNKACWYALHVHPNNFAAGAYGNFRKGDGYTKWNNSSQCLQSTGLYCPVSSAYIAHQKAQHSARKAMQRAESAKKAIIIWNRALPVTTHHPYLNRKNIPSLGLRVWKHQVVVALQNITGELVNLQFIDAAGNKKYLKGGEVKGCFSLLGASHIPDIGEVYICEGIATGQTIWGRLKVPVVCAMSCGNLVPVCTTIREKYPNLGLVVAADNDHQTNGNPGITKATEAAQTTNSQMTWPRTCGNDCTCTDFNDYANCKNTEGF